MENDHQDKLLTCRECGSDFIFSSREQDFYAQKGFDHEPTRCTQCRNERRRDRPVSAVGSAPMRQYNQSQPHQSFHNAPSGNQRQAMNAAPPRTGGGISNGYRANSYSNRQFGPNYSTLGRNTTGGGNTTRPSANNGGYYNGNTARPNHNGFNNMNNAHSHVNTLERKMYPIVCMRCGINTEVPFTPREGAPVFCRTCYNSQKNSR